MVFKLKCNAFFSKIIITVAMSYFDIAKRNCCVPKVTFINGVAFISVLVLNGY